MGQSAEFGKFLKAMRSRLSPEEAGADGTSSARRVPGLRREEVARLAGVSTDYYIRLEQGRNIHPSRAVLDSVSRALRLDSSEHAHMMDLLENCAVTTRSPGPAQGVRLRSANSWKPWGTYRRWCLAAAPTSWPGTGWRSCCSRISWSFRPSSGT